MVTTTTQKRYSLDDLIKTVKKLSLSERETLEMLLDSDFTKGVLRRSQAIDRLRKQNRLLSLNELKK